jgi:amidohydrolase
MTDLEVLKQRVIAEVDARADHLVQLARAIHDSPELAFEEFEAAALLGRTLEEQDFALERGVAGLQTAFVARMQGQADGPVVAFLAEYDALAGLGHACGHNLIAAAAVGAGLAMKAVLPDLSGSIQVIGTPAEEEGGGKILMVEAGVFAGVDAAMMVHPSNRNLVGRLSLAAYPVRMEFFGRAAHAAGSPDKGLNALDGVLLTFNGINALRQHLRDDARIHGIITHGGNATNIVPDYAAAEFLVRALDTTYATEVLARVQACAEGAARATGTRLQFETPGLHYDPRRPNAELSGLFKENLESLGLDVGVARGDERMGSSDIGNVSQVVPAIHPYIAIGSEDLVGHSIEFRKAAASEEGLTAMLNGAKALAMTAVDLLARPVLVESVWRVFHSHSSPNR